MKKKYWIDCQNHVFCEQPNKKYLLKVSPWEENEDRRLFHFEQKLSQMKQLSENEAFQIINEQFAHLERSWRFNNKTYYVLSSDKKIATYEKTKGVKHIFKSILYTSDNQQIVWEDTYYLCWFRGHIYWLVIDMYTPRVRLYLFRSIDIPPKDSDFAQWTSRKNCKIIYSNNQMI